MLINDGRFKSDDRAREARLSYLMGLPDDVLDKDRSLAIGSATKTSETDRKPGGGTIRIAGLGEIPADMFRQYDRLMASRAQAQTLPDMLSVAGRGMQTGRDETIMTEIPLPCAQESPIDCCDPNIKVAYVRHTLLDAITRSQPLSYYEIITVPALATVEFFKFTTPSNWWAVFTMVLFELFDNDIQHIRFEILVNDAVCQYAPKIQPWVPFWTWIPLKETNTLTLRVVNLLNCVRTCKARADGFIQVPRCYGH
jgi:hypothetical protein